MLKLSRTTICLAAALCVALAGTAVAAPAGNEYLPRPPSVTGGKDESSGGQSGGGGGGTGGTESNSVSGVSGGSGGSGGGTGGGGSGGGAEGAGGGEQGNGPQGSGSADDLPNVPRDESIAALTASAQEDDEDEGVLGTLLDPYVLGGLALVAIVLAALLLRRRRGPEATPPRPGRGLPDPKGS